MEFVNCSVLTQRGMTSYDASYLAGNFYSLLGSNKLVTLNFRQDDGSLVGIDFGKLVRGFGVANVGKLIGQLLEPIPEEFSHLNSTFTPPYSELSELTPIGVIRLNRTIGNVITKRVGASINTYTQIGFNPDCRIYVNATDLFNIVVVTGLTPDIVGDLVNDNRYAMVWSGTLNPNFSVRGYGGINLSSGITLVGPKQSVKMRMRIPNNGISMVHYGQFSRDNISDMNMFVIRKADMLALMCCGDNKTITYSDWDATNLYDFRTGYSLRINGTMRISAIKNTFVGNFPQPWPLFGNYSTDYYDSSITHYTPVNNTLFYSARIVQNYGTDNIIQFDGYAVKSGSTVFSTTPPIASAIWDAVSKSYVYPSAGTLVYNLEGAV